MHRKTILC